METDGPRLSADMLHPWIWNAARGLWDTRHYREAVQAAATSLNAHLQAIASRRDISDTKLIAELFSENDPTSGKPRLRWPGTPSDESVKSMQSGLRGLGQGIFLCIRNITTHDLAELTEQEALEYLAILSRFAHWIENCKLVEA